ncbi:hypothetical protein MSAN_00844900 [Mycena sanguinolenta]|uniref:Uncharacterized protein n=1 Tax=Mycena sanguinolenta TaxID=230812 RepID=A0A8H6YZF8_9AGAR|nr:hypothetical protein MSAN_00844900 [Mycena sanguinolenta]
MSFIPTISIAHQLTLTKNENNTNESAFSIGEDYTLVFRPRRSPDPWASAEFFPKIDEDCIEISFFVGVFQSTLTRRSGTLECPGGIALHIRMDPAPAGVIGLDITKSYSYGNANPGPAWPQVAFFPKPVEGAGEGGRGYMTVEQVEQGLLTPFMTEVRVRLVNGAPITIINHREKGEIPGAVWDGAKVRMRWVWHPHSEDFGIALKDIKLIKVTAM